MKIALKMTVFILATAAVVLAVQRSVLAGRLAPIAEIPLTLLLLALCGAVTAALTFTLVGHPVRKLIDVVGRFEAGDLAARLALRQRDEIGLLAHVMSQMIEHLALAQKRLDEEAQAHLAALEQLRHADRLATVGKLVAGIAHELGTPLSTVANRATAVASGEATGEEARQNARIIVTQSTRMTNIIRQTLDYARRGGPQRRQVDLMQLVRQSFSLVRPLASRHKALLRAVADTPDPVAEVDPGKLLQALVNLVTNGIQAMPGGGSLTVTISRGQVVPPEGNGVEGEHVCIGVRDEGSGIPAEHRKDIFHAFFTTKAPGEGTGLGLPIAQGIVHEHGGWIEVESEIGRGTCFKVLLPQGASS